MCRVVGATRGHQHRVGAARQPARRNLLATALLRLQRVLERDEVEQATLGSGNLCGPVPAGEMGARRSLVRQRISPDLWVPAESVERYRQMHESIFSNATG
jgi:hypothetical protein